MMDKNLYKSDSILKKRIRKFKTIKRAYYSLIILIIAYIFSLSASFFVSSTALIVRYTNNMYDMGEEYRKASLVICRAGATTIAEINACGKMSIIIPFPHAAHNHQEKNARILESANAGELVLDEELSGQRIAKSIIQAMENPERLEIMEKNSYKLGNRKATEKVRRLCMELLEEANRKSGRTKFFQGNKQVIHAQQ